MLPYLLIHSITLFVLSNTSYYYCQPISLFILIQYQHKYKGLLLYRTVTYRTVSYQQVITSHIIPRQQVITSHIISYKVAIFRYQKYILTIFLQHRFDMSMELILFIILIFIVIYSDGSFYLFQYFSFCCHHFS